MLESQVWRGTVSSAEARVQLDELRADALRLFLVFATLGYLVWHFANTVMAFGEDVDRAYSIAPAVVAVLVFTFLLARWSQVAAGTVFVFGGVVSIAWAIYVLATPEAAALYPMLVLVAAFVLTPTVGVATAGASIGLLALVGGVRPGLIGESDLWHVAVFSALSVAGVWALKRHLLLALNWYAQSYAEAERRTEEAREHRAQLVQAWKQLDSAYYRLERANAALQLAWKAADEAERSKMELATNISHELRTPLNLIVGYGEMMMASPGSYGGVPLPPAYRGDLNAIYRAAQHLLSLTDDVLDLARLEVGRFGLHREAVDLGQTVGETISLVSDYVASKGLELRSSLPGDLPRLLLDRVRIRQVLLNLLTNAARATEHGHIEVRVTRLDQEVRVAVSDTGPGIAPEVAASLFERFVTRDPAGAHGRGGTGLGLPISKRFVQLHGGDMGVESRVGVGTTFWFTLPLAAPAGDETQPPSLLRSTPVSRSDQEQVLVLAIPDPGLGHLLQRHLEGYRVEVADGLADAAGRALELKATAILSDLNTPDPNTHDSQAAGPVPVVRCPLPQMSRLAESLGVDCFLPKPVSREALLGAIQRLGTPIRRVLVVDDDTRFVRLLSRMLGSDDREYVVTTAHNGEEGLARLRAERQDLLLLDLLMPGLDGLGVLRAIAGDDGLRGLKVIVISAHDEGESVLPLGYEVRISKPEGFHLAEVTDVIGAAISRLAPTRGYLTGTDAVPRGAPPERSA